MDLDCFVEANYKNHIIKSKIPDKTKQEPCLLGIDEAGRGPVLGPMVYGICYCPLKFENDLKNIKVADSKTLTEEQREDLFETLANNSDNIGWMVQLLSPNTISNGMLGRCKYNLNEMSHDSAICLVENAIKDGVNIAEIYVDTVGDPKKYETKLSQKFPDIKVTVSKKADSIYSIVSAASIVAKVARDRALKMWKFQETLEDPDMPYGSGYPNDPETKAFLQENCDKIFGFPQLVRFSWSTAEKIVEDKCIPVDWEEVDENGEAVSSSTNNLLNYFSHSSSSDEIKTHAYFTERNLKPVTQLF